MENTVTISLKYFDSLRDFRSSIENGDLYEVLFYDGGVVSYKFHNPEDRLKEYVEYLAESKKINILYMEYIRVLQEQLISIGLNPITIEEFKLKNK